MSTESEALDGLGTTTISSDFLSKFSQSKLVARSESSTPRKLSVGGPTTENVLDIPEISPIKKGGIAEKLFGKAPKTEGLNVPEVDEIPADDTYSTPEDELDYLHKVEQEIKDELVRIQARIEEMKSTSTPVQDAMADVSDQIMAIIGGADPRDVLNKR